MRNYFVLAVCAIFLVSCGKGGTISSTSKKINGPLGKFFEVVERDYKIDDGKVSIEFKRISEGGPTDASWSSKPTFTVELLDEDGNSISSESSDVTTSKEQLETVFALGVDETASISFNFDDFKKAAKFKVSSKWSEGEDDSKKNGTYRLHGFVDKYPVTMFFETNGSSVKGSYYYDKKGPTAKLRLTGTNENGVLDINETDASGTPTGHFRGKLVNGKFKGVFSDNKGNKMPFELSEDNSVGFSSDSDFDLSDDMTDETYDETASSYDDAGDSSYDELLDEYEKFYRTYMRFIKKMDKDDPTAMVEYAKLMKQYNDYAAKWEKAEGNLSTSQLNRLNKINAELTEEMLKIHNQ